MELPRCAFHSATCRFRLHKGPARGGRAGPPASTGGRWIVLAVPIETRSIRRRSIPRFLARNAKWVAEARDTLPLWMEWASEEPELEPEQRGRAVARRPADAREEE